NGDVLVCRYDPYLIGYNSLYSQKDGTLSIIGQAKRVDNQWYSNTIFTNDSEPFWGELPTIIRAVPPQPIQVRQTRPVRAEVPEPETRTLRERNRQHTRNSSNGTGMTEKVKALFKPRNGWE